MGEKYGSKIYNLQSQGSVQVTRTKNLIKEYARRGTIIEAVPLSFTNQNSHVSFSGSTGFSGNLVTLPQLKDLLINFLDVLNLHMQRNWFQIQLKQVS